MGRFEDDTEAERRRWDWPDVDMPVAVMPVDDDPKLGALLELKFDPVKDDDGRLEEESPEDEGWISAELESFEDILIVLEGNADDVEVVIEVTVDSLEDIA